MPSLEGPFEGPLDDDDGVVPIPTAGVVDFVARALNRLPYQFRQTGSTNITRLVTLIVAPYQELQVALMQLLLYRTLDTAVASNLDVLGKVVGQSRNGLGDDDYRRYIRARIATNRSRGTRDDLIRIAQLILNDTTATIEVTTSGTASAVVRVKGSIVLGAIADILIVLLRSGKSAGVRLNLETETATDTVVFDDSVHGFDDHTMAEARS